MNTSAEPWPSVLVVDDDEDMLRTLVCFFEQRGLHAAPVTTLAGAKLLFHRRKSWSMVLSDYHLPDGTGWEFCCWLREQPGATPPFLLMSGGLAAGTVPGIELIAKPFNPEKLAARVHALVGSSALLRVRPA